MGGWRAVRRYDAANQGETVLAMCDTGVGVDRRYAGILFGWLSLAARSEFSGTGFSLAASPALPTATAGGCRRKARRARERRSVSRWAKRSHPPAWDSEGGVVDIS